MKKRPTKARGKWWRKQPSSGKHQNRRIYVKVGHLNPHADTGPSLLLQAMFVGMGREYMRQVKLRKAA